MIIDINNRVEKPGYSFLNCLYIQNIKNFQYTGSHDSIEELTGHKVAYKVIFKKEHALSIAEVAQINSFLGKTCLVQPYPKEPWIIYLTPDSFPIIRESIPSPNDYSGHLPGSYHQEDGNVHTVIVRTV